jgi:hypothetical protein
MAVHNNNWRLVISNCLLVAIISLPARSEPARQGPSDSETPDPGTEVVDSFYKVLLQKEPPTLEQEKSLFGEQPWFRRYLETRNNESDKDPVILICFRSHKDLFTPANMRSPRQIQISSTFCFLRDVEYVKDANAPKCVMAMFTDDGNRLRGKNMEIIFSITGDGRIEPDAIAFGGFGSKLSGQLFFGE